MHYLCVPPCCQVYFFTQWIGDRILGCNQHGLQMIKYTSRSKGAEAPLWITNISPMTGSYNTLIALCYRAHILLRRAMSRLTSHRYSSHITLAETRTEVKKWKDLITLLRNSWETVTRLAFKSFEASTWFLLTTPCVIYIYITALIWK